MCLGLTEGEGLHVRGGGGGLVAADTAGGVVPPTEDLLQLGGAWDTQQ